MIEVSYIEDKSKSEFNMVYILYKTPKESPASTPMETTSAFQSLSEWLLGLEATLTMEESTPLRWMWSAKIWSAAPAMQFLILVDGYTLQWHLLDTIFLSVVEETAIIWVIIFLSIMPHEIF